MRVFSSCAVVTSRGWDKIVLAPHSRDREYVKYSARNSHHNDPAASTTASTAHARTLWRVVFKLVAVEFFSFAGEGGRASLLSCDSNESRASSRLLRDPTRLEPAPEPQIIPIVFDGSNALLVAAAHDELVRGEL